MTKVTSLPYLGVLNRNRSYSPLSNPSPPHHHLQPNLDHQSGHGMTDPTPTTIPHQSLHLTQQCPHPRLQGCSRRVRPCYVPCPPYPNVSPWAPCPPSIFPQMGKKLSWDDRAAPLTTSCLPTVQSRVSMYAPCTDPRLMPQVLHQSS